MKKRLLITGGSGFVGSAIVEAQREQHSEWALTVFDLRLPAEAKADVIYKTGDISDAAHVDEVIAQVQPTVIIHSAGIVPPLASRYGR